MTNETRNMKRATTFLPLYHDKKIRAIAKLRNISISRLIAFAVDNELLKEKPFAFDCDLPTEDFVEYAYADQAGKLLNFMKTLRTGAALDILMLLRFDIGIPDKLDFLAAFRECLTKAMIEGSKPHRIGVNYGDNYLYYNITGQPTARSRKMKGKEYAHYQKLKKKFEGEE